jgi:hypothetical protein
MMAGPLNRIIINRARVLISDEKNWCRGVLARNERGDAVDPTDSTAFRRCAYGALVAAAYELVHDIPKAHNLAVAAAREAYCTSSLISINDHSGHAAVLSVFDQALSGD